MNKCTISYLDTNPNEANQNTLTIATILTTIKDIQSDIEELSILLYQYQDWDEVICLINTILDGVLTRNIQVSVASKFIQFTWETLTIRISAIEDTIVRRREINLLVSYFLSFCYTTTINGNTVIIPILSFQQQTGILSYILSLVQFEYSNKVDPSILFTTLKFIIDFSSPILYGLCFSNYSAREENIEIPLEKQKLGADILILLDSLSSGNYNLIISEPQLLLPLNYLVIEPIQRSIERLKTLERESQNGIFIESTNLLHQYYQDSIPSTIIQPTTSQLEKALYMASFPNLLFAPLASSSISIPRNILERTKNRDLYYRTQWQNTFHTVRIQLPVIGSEKVALEFPDIISKDPILVQLREEQLRLVPEALGDLIPVIIALPREESTQYSNEFYSIFTTVIIDDKGEYKGFVSIANNRLLSSKSTTLTKTIPSLIDFTLELNGEIEPDLYGSFFAFFRHSNGAKFYKEYRFTSIRDLFTYLRTGLIEGIYKPITEEITLRDIVYREKIPHFKPQMILSIGEVNNPYVLGSSLDSRIMKQMAGLEYASGWE